MKKVRFSVSVQARKREFPVKPATVLSLIWFALLPNGWSQVISSPPIFGRGTPNHIAKFHTRGTITDTGILESQGCVSESPTFDRAVAGILCLHDLSGSGATVHAVASFPDRTTVVVENDSPTGDPVAILGTTGSADRGIGLRGQATNSSGNGIAILGEEYGAAGTAGVFNAIGGGNILLGIGFNAFSAFRVDATGNVFASSYNVGGADFAESVAILGDRHQYEPGDLLAIDPSGDRRLTIAENPYSSLVAGIYSTKPGVIGSTHRMDDPALTSEIPLAVVGIVPCKVSAENGPISVGDLLVTSSSPGRAMKGTDRQRMLGAVIGKALQPLPAGNGLIEVLVTLQ